MIHLVLALNVLVYFLETRGIYAQLKNRTKNKGHDAQTSQPF